MTGGPPICVTGSHRSGTTWVGRMLCASKEAGYIHEPLNPVRRPTWSRDRVPYWYVYICDENEDRFGPQFEHLSRFRYPILGNLKQLRSPQHFGAFVTEAARSIPLRLRKPRPLYKDPFALFSSEWLESRFDTRMVVMIRHPAAFVGSIKRLNWQFKFKTILAQELLMRDWLHPFEAQMVHVRDNDVDVIEQGIVLWNVLHHAIEELRRRHPGWAFVRHEDLASEPVTGFQRLYDHCGLTWSLGVEATVRAHSAAGNKKEVATWRHGSVKRDSSAATATWRHRLTPDEIARVKDGVAEISTRFYPEPEWGLAS